jgi:hypothetical protein
MVGTPVERGEAIGRPGRAEEELEGLLDAPRAIPMADISGEDLPLRGPRIVKGLAHR